jgi:hypothetical protein
MKFIWSEKIPYFIYDACYLHIKNTKAISIRWVSVCGAHPMWEAVVLLMRKYFPLSTQIKCHVCNIRVYRTPRLQREPSLFSAASEQRRRRRRKKREMADKPSRALVLYGDGLARFIDPSHNNLHSLASKASCGFLTLPNAPPSGSTLSFLFPSTVV